MKHRKRLVATLVYSCRAVCINTVHYITVLQWAIDRVVHTCTINTSLSLIFKFLQKGVWSHMPIFYPYSHFPSSRFPLGVNMVCIPIVNFPMVDFH